MDVLAKSLLRGLKEEITESSVKLEEACDNALRDLEKRAPQLMASQVHELKNVAIEILYGHDSVESPSWKEYHRQWENRLIDQLSFALENHLNQPMTDSELIEKLRIDRKDKDNQLNGISHGPKQVIDGLKSNWDNFVINTVTKMRDILIRSIGEQTAQIGQSVLPEISITLVFPTSRTTNLLMYHAEPDSVKVDCIYHLPSITLDTNVVLKMKRGEILTPWKLREKCPMDLAVTQRIRDDLSLNCADEQFLKNSYI